MIRNLEQQKAIVRTKLHNAAGNPPKCNPFTGIGRQQWEAYTETCRSLEEILVSMGEQI